MAKRKKKKRLKKQFRFIFGFISFSAFLFLIFELFAIGKMLLLPDSENLPSTHQALTPVAIGIDVSEWQSDIDWDAVKAEGYSFAIIRTSFGVENTSDAMFINHVEGAKEAGLDVGAYHYSHATSVEEALAEADYFISLLNLYRWEYPVYYDIETDRQDHLSREELTEIAKAFLDRVSEAGYETGIYASEYWLEHRLDMDELAEYEVWIASYTDNLNYEGNYAMWQYTKTGDVEGISGDADINIAYYDYPSHIKNTRKNNY